jgi:hypothetical protein
VAAAAGAGDQTRPAVLAAAGGVLTLGGALHEWRRRPDGPFVLGVSPLATSAIVAGAVLVLLAVRSWLQIDDDTLDMFLAAAGVVFVAVGLTGDERRLVGLGVLQWAIALGRPHAGDVPFHHCLVAPDVAVPLPRLDPLVVLGLAVFVAGTVLRWAGWRREAGRGAEVTGLVLLLGGLVAKGVELTGLEVLCGDGYAVDRGWMLLAYTAGAIAAGYGIVTRDATVAAVGGLAVGLAGFAGTILTGTPWWAATALVPVVAALGWAERHGTSWPHRPAYDHARPWSRPDSAPPRPDSAPPRPRPGGDAP